MPPLITYRRLDASKDTDWTTAPLTDADAVAQAILTRLLLFQGEWWADQLEGVPYWQQILGVNSGKDPGAVTLLIQQRILGTPFVTGVSQLQSSYDPASRRFTFFCVVQTQFGQVAVSNQPRPPQVQLP